MLTCNLHNAMTYRGIISLTYQVRRLRLREVKKSDQGLTASKRQSGKLTQSILFQSPTIDCHILHLIAFIYPCNCLPHFLSIKSPSFLNL